MTLSLSLNQELARQLPTLFGRLTSLKSHDVSGNKLRVTISTQTESLANFELLRMDLNYFTWMIPTQMDLMTSLSTLSTRWNDSSGTLPAEIGRLSTLNQFELRGNHPLRSHTQTGGFLTRLKVLDLSDNRINNSIPSEIDAPAGLSLVSIQTIRFQGWFQHKYGYCRIIWCLP